MERSDLFHRLAAELDARGIGRTETMPTGSASPVADALGTSTRTLKKLKCYLKKADGDPDLAHTMRNSDGSARSARRQRERYRSEPEYRDAKRAASKKDRAKNFQYHLFKATRGNARTRGLHFDLTRTWVEEALEPMTCSVTGLPLSTDWDGSGRNPRAPSLDQVDPCGGYVEGNVRVVCWAFNVMRGQLRDKTVATYCEALLRGEVGADPEAGIKLQARRFGSAKPARYLWANWRESAEVRGLDFDLSRGWVERRLDRGVCEVTGLSLSWDRIDGAFRRPLAPSADRIDVARGYTEDNVRVVSSWYNYARQDWEDALVLRVAEAALAS